METETNKSALEDLIVGLHFAGDSVLVVKAGGIKYFPSFKLDHKKTDEEKVTALGKYIERDFGGAMESAELVAHLQKDPKDLILSFLDSHLFLYKIGMTPGQTMK
ncbi:MAG: hypothetical protein QME74_06925, partial [Candidatus Edwardsbacteria bacterium]|nr:hypothetical protein [Candidatus Edwardsbacteria bacterium]